MYRSLEVVDMPAKGEGSFRVAVCQIPISIGEPRANRRSAELAILEAAKAKANVVVLPELVNSGYVFKNSREARRFAEPVPGRTTDEWVRLAKEHELVVVGGICQAARDGTLRNAAVMVDHDGILAVYHKAHLYGPEKAIFTPGNDPPPVLDTRFGRISMMVCYDIEFPEWVRLPAIGGADMICLPTNWPRLLPDPGPYPAEVLRVLGNASMNRLYIAVAARVGSERGVDWIGESGVASPSGAWSSMTVNESAVLVTEIDINERARLAEVDGDHIYDRRPELYGPIVEVRDQTPGHGRPNS